MTAWLPALHFTAFILITGYALYCFFHVIYSRALFIRMGEETELEANHRERLRVLIVQMLGHKTLLKDRKSGIMHFVMFYGFMILQLGAIDLIGKGIVQGWHLPLGTVYPYFLFVQELTVILVLLAVVYAGYRRYIEKLPRLKRGWKAGIVLVFIFALMLSILTAQGMEMIWRGQEATALQPGGSAVLLLMQGVGPHIGGVLFYVFWWTHLLILLSFLVYVPQSKHAHILFAPLNLYLRKIGPPGKLKRVDFDDDTAEQYGVSKIEHFTRAQLVDLYACVECGRCTAVCPASATGKLLSPMSLIVNMRDHLTLKGAVVTSRTPWMPAFVASAQRTYDTEQAAERDLVGAIVSEQELWACTTCRNCEEACPVANEHVDKIIDMRRYLVLTEGRIAPEAGRTMSHIERQGNPWGLSRNDRDKWKEGLEEGLTAPSVQEGKPFEYLFYVGSMGSYDNRSMKITRAFIKLLNRAGVSFAVLGNEERSSGDTARRLGNEYLYQQLAMDTIELLKKYKVRKIVTIDPHAFHTFANEYKDFGLPEEVVIYHHTQLIAAWVREGRLRPSHPLKRTITYHDPCYLGRHNRIYEDPRSALAAIPGLAVTEMTRNRSNAMCCGAGGGLMWLEEREGKRMNVERTEQALAEKPELIATACPYCLTMMSDGVKALEAAERVEIMDIAEIVAGSI